jgi:hypothetical protein
VSNYDRTTCVLEALFIAAAIKPAAPSL